MKGIFKFKHWQKTSTNKIQKIIKNKKVIGVIGASRKMGVTHICLCIANFLQSALKQNVLYIELAEDSQLLPVVGEKQINFDGHIAFSYKKVTYVLACDGEEAVSLINSWNGHIVIDVADYSKKSYQVLCRCDKKIMIGSLQPWCIKDVEMMIEKLKGDGLMEKIIYIYENDTDTKPSGNPLGCAIRTRPFIENPLKLKEEDFNAIVEMIL